MGWPRRFHLHTSHKVTTTIDRNESWEIDGPVLKRPSENLRVQPISVRALPSDLHESDKYPKTSSSSSSATSMGTHSFRIPSSGRLPWKRKPPRIRLVPATARFRVDEVKGVLTSSGEAVERNEFNMAQEAEDPAHVLPGDEETTSLITHSERETRDSQDVILISKGGRTFTLESRSENTVSVNSHIKIISPSVSSESPHSTMQPVSARVSHRSRTVVPYMVFIGTCRWLTIFCTAHAIYACAAAAT
jgi:hypothetical protein